MRKLTVFVIAALALAVGAASALADSARVSHFSTTVSDTATYPAGQACDFPYQEQYTITVQGANHYTATGELRFTRTHSAVTVTHRNLATGASLSETDHINELFAADGSYTATGLFFHLRTPDGKLVVVEAGKLTISPTGAITVTPKVSPVSGVVNCEALGGHYVGG